MKWSKNKSNQVTFYTAEADDSARSNAMIELWQIFADEVLPQNQSVDWDYIRVEFWANSGRIVVFPASSRIEQRVENAGCQVRFSELLLAYNQLTDADIDDDEFCIQLTAILAVWFNDLEQTVMISKLSGHRISFWDAESDVAFREIELKA